MHLAPGEYITKIDGTAVMSWWGEQLLGGLTLTSNLGTTYGLYGGTGGTAFSVDAGGGRLAWISGKDGSAIDNLKFHFIGC